MKRVVDANVVLSALIVDSKTRGLIVSLEPDLSTPAFVYDEIANYEELIVEKSGIKPDRVAQFVDERKAIRIERAGEKSLVVTSMNPHTLARTVERAGRIGG
jgi:hypothetical protein